MTMSDMMNFDMQVVSYINDNLQYIKEYAEEGDDLSEMCLNHYNESTVNSADEESYLSNDQKERFYEVAKRLFKQGFVEHAGHLHD
jgi:hypothetical protein